LTLDYCRKDIGMELSRNKDVLIVYMGPMCGQKTTTLINLANKYKDKYKILYLKITLVDDGSIPKSINIVARGDIELNDIDSYSITNDFGFEALQDEYFCEMLLDEYDIIMIEEIQFLEEKNYDKVLDLLEGKSLIISGLDMDYRGTPFYSTLWFAAKADYVEKLHPLCSNEECNRNAVYSHKESGDMEKRLEEGQDMYRPLCRECYIEMTGMI